MESRICLVYTQKSSSVRVLLLIGALLGITSVQSCFIRNCPPGGKRSIPLVSRGAMPCLSCGPDNSGQCVGPNICCGLFGCYFGTEEARVCEKENQNSEPCHIRGEQCGKQGQGHCVADGVCCDAKACSFNMKCVLHDRNGSAQILSLLNKLLQSDDLQ